MFYHNNGRFDLDNFKEEYPGMEIYWEMLAAVGAATGSKELMRYAQERDGELISMCTALDNLMKESERRGELKGEKRGELRGKRKGIQEMVLVLKEFDIEDASILQKLQEKFQLDYDEAKGFLLHD